MYSRCSALFLHPIRIWPFHLHITMEFIRKRISLPFDFDVTVRTSALLLMAVSHYFFNSLLRDVGVRTFLCLLSQTAITHLAYPLLILPETNSRVKFSKIAFGLLFENPMFRLLICLPLCFSLGESI